MQRVIPTGCSSIDKQLGGGLLGGRLLLVYGEAETGKTTFAIQCAVNCAKTGFKTFFIDCDGAFFPRRMVQIAAHESKEIGSQIMLMKPETLEQQAVIIDKLNEYISKKVGLIIFDTITSLYSEALGDDKQSVFSLNRQLNRQMAYLAQISRTQKVASLVVGQVRSVMNKYDLVQPVAMRVLKYWADAVIILNPTTEAHVIKATIKTRATQKPSKQIFLKLGEKGLHE
ncbi:MAG: AAA family ATPase [Candidatus Bathyarchaeota archaeon]|nr:MAG: AAA family ATPase [Candidatus Bathyarchaeota archaeon]